ncbi:MAG: membrane protein insertase YidC [bacterium]|nr:membrane protein insertase YidC [bacterium]
MFDRNTLIAIVLIFLIFVGWQFFNQPAPRPPQPAGITADSLAQSMPENSAVAPATAPESMPVMDSAVVSLDSIPEKLISVETKYYSAVLTNKGAGISKLTLKEYKYTDGKLLEMLPVDAQPVPTVMSAISGFTDHAISFTSNDQDVNLAGGTGSQIVTFTAQIPNRGEIVKQFTFYADKYDFDLVLKINGVQQLGLDKEYVLSWMPGIPATEKNISDDFSNYKSAAYMAGELQTDDSFENGKMVRDITGNAEWVASRSKYFAYAIIPDNHTSNGAYFRGTEKTRVGVDGSYNERVISTGIIMPSGANLSIENKFKLFVGPLEYDVLKHYNTNLEDLMNWGWKIIKPFSHAIFWLTVQLHKFIPNYGVVIIVISILIKLVTFPLTRKSLKSMAAMKNLAPKMEELKAKYKSDPQKLNQSIMKLYKEEGVNPFSGCLLLLPQMPLLYGFYTVFSSTIEFRQAYFIGLWPDLSQPDPFPYIMPIIMTLAMFFQQKMSITDPKQKMLVYLMPVMFFFFMKGLPVGLVLYWSMYSILSIGEQLLIKRNDLQTLNPQVK